MIPLAEVPLSADAQNSKRLDARHLRDTVAEPHIAYVATKLQKSSKNWQDSDLLILQVLQESMDLFSQPQGFEQTESGYTT